MNPGKRFPPPPLNRRNLKRVNYKTMNPMGNVNGNFMVPMQGPIKVVLMVGDRQFVGLGNTIQGARHDAASKALEALKPITPDVAAPLEGAAGGTEDEIAAVLDSKSPVSLIHEMALKRSLTVVFEVKNEKGPPHMKVYITACNVGDITVEGEGNSKKASKKSAAEKMYQELLKLPPLTPSPQPTAQAARNAKLKKRSPELMKKKTKNIIKEKLEPEVQEELNPISRLIQIQQAKKENEPIYTLVDQHGPPRRREFIIEVNVNGKTAQGTGSNKKMAKRKAAESE